MGQQRIATHCRHTTPYYDLVLLTSPARIESLGVDPSGSGRHLGVINNFGRMGTTLFAAYGGSSDIESNAQVAGRPARVIQTESEIRLERVPVGEGIYAEWVFSFDERTFDMSISWTVESGRSDIWELGWKLDAAARHIGADRSADLANADLASFADGTEPFLIWWDDDPRYAHTLAVTVVPESADRGDVVRCEIPHDRPTTSGMWCTVFAPGGTELRPGTLEAGRWRFGASDRPGDLSYARALRAEVTGGAAAMPAVTRDEASTERAAALAFAEQLGEQLAGPPTGRSAARGQDGSWLLCDDVVLVAFVPREQWWSCWIYVHVEPGWQLAATAADHMTFTEVAPDDRDGLAVTGLLCGPDRTAQTTTRQVWTLRTDPRPHDAAASGVVQVRALDTPVDGHVAHPMHGFLAYPGGLGKDEIDRYDVLSSPVLRPQSDLVIGQRAMWSPSVHVQHGTTSIALIPDLLAHCRPGGFGAMPDDNYFGLTLDLDIASRLADAPVLSFGWRTVQGVFGYYFRDAGRTPAEPTELAYDLVVRAGATPHSVTSDVQRRLWERVGSGYVRQSVLPQTQPAESAFDEAWSYWVDQYQSAEIGGRTVGAVRVDRVHEPGINFMSWFNALRTSYGLFTIGRDRGDADLTAKGRSTLELLLAAPQESGAFPTIADLADDGITWQASHRNFLNQMPWGPTSYNTFDMGWAAFWLLRWHQDLEPEPRAVEFARTYGDFVLEHQLPSGAVPSWLAVGTLDVDARLRESAQTASSMMLLAELARVTGDSSYLDGAARAGRYVVDHHLDPQRWDDFEPYYSNTLKSEGAHDPFSGQHTQNTLSMHFAATGLLTLHELSGERSWLDHGVRAVDTYLQYQYVTPGLGLSMNCFGGFAVQNTDNEALDARQSQFGVTLLDYARATGRAEYAERGVAALRAGLATMCSPSAEIINPKYFDAHPTGLGPENYAHATFDTPAEFSIFDWGQGSAAAGFAEARNRFGDVWVDVRSGLAVGIDDVTVEFFEFRGDEMAIRLGPLTPGHTVVLKVDGLAVPHVKLRVWPEAARTFSRTELEAGVVVPARHAPRIAHNPTRDESIDLS